MGFARLAAVCVCEEESPATELRLFRAGINETSKGSFIFDAASAASVFAEHAKVGTDIMFDLEHLSLDPHHPNYNPDAMGWSGLELRSGELWVTGIKWTTEGQFRLRDKRQRYLSPAILFDESTRRVTSLVNVGLVAQPATYGSQQLIAASRRAQLSTGKPMDKTLIQSALDALIAGDAEKCAEVLKQIITSEVVGEEAVDPMDGMPAGAPPADGADAGAGLSIDKSGATLLLSSLLRVTDAADPSEALQIVETWGKAQEEVRAQRAGLELSSRRMLIADLVKLGVETPGTAWEGDDKSSRLPVARLMAEPIDALRARVAILAKSVTRSAPALLRPASDDAPAVTLSEREQSLIKASGISEMEFVERKNAMLSKASVNHKLQVSK